MIHFACPHCRAGLRAGNDKVGKRTHCPKCGSPIEVPPAQGESVPPAALDQSPSVSDSGDLEPAWEQHERKQKTGFLLLSLFVSGLVCGTLVFLVVFIKMKEAKPPRVASAEQSQARPAAGEPLLPGLPPKRRPVKESPEENKETANRTDPVPSAPTFAQGPPAVQLPGKEVREPKEEEFEVSPKKTASVPIEPLETPGRPSPPAKPLDDSSLRESEALVAPFVKDLQHQKVTERVKAIDAVAQLGPKGKAASRALCESLLDPSPSVRLAAAEALDKVNPTLHRLVIPIMVDKQLETRLECLRKIGQLGPEGKPAVPVVISFKRQYQGGGLCVEVLAAIAPDDKAVATKVATWLATDSDPYVRLAAAKVLPHMEGGKGHVRAFMQLLRSDPVDAVRAAAAGALGDLGPDAKDADKVLRIAKTDSSAQVREAAERALEKIQKRK